EEATSPSLTEELRRQMGEVACSIATLGKYKNAGTVEFLLQDGQFYLLEVNTRLQVEHPVTEEVMGVDLVKMQILTAQNQFIFNKKEVRVARGHSIECRVYAENPYQMGMPSTGLLGQVTWPEGPRRRYEYGFEEGDVITSHYDPMIAKVIVWDETRPRAIEKMIRTLKDSTVFGVHTNIPYLIEILDHEEFRSGHMTTRFIETYFAEGIKNKTPDDQIKKLALSVYKKMKTLKTSAGAAGSSGETSQPSPWGSHWRGV
ncbi:MAG: acetyl-CoA carboxylase biotin carboxylase subunit, partial [Bdellovibrionaceae bacterium]|nr:acetyl-CoA carboxylase biotin carboxylase subunit [Pseudobdellovibrionaceae bacterium]